MNTAAKLLNGGLENAFHRLRQIRAEHPEEIAKAHANRQRPAPHTGDGNLFIIAADHPARGALGVGKRANAMADRYELLTRLITALARPGVDGILGTADIIDDLTVLGALEGKIAVGSMNRGGLSGASFELDDKFTGYSIETIAAQRLDFAKTLLRIGLDDHGTARTLHNNAKAVRAAAAAKIPIMIEPFISEHSNGTLRNVLTTEAVIRSIAVASGLGDNSAYTWLKIPVVANMEQVMRATTLPTLLLGGDPSGPLNRSLEQWETALSQPGVRGLVVGRTLIYPEHDNVAKVVDEAAALVHPALRQ